jgi:ubiquinone/menaquinone biosynthesis C-methylase UbiE
MMASEQTNKWNSPAVHGWIELQDTLEQMFRPLEDVLVAAVAARSARSVLDVGCGTGGTTIAAARALGADARCIGIDVSEPLLAAASARAKRAGVPVRFIAADAQTHAFERSAFDMIVSRFGVMFFDDFRAAFTNLRRAASEGAGLRLITWRQAEENPFMTTAERAAAPLLPDLPARVPDAPGQFGLASEVRIREILARSGWQHIEIKPLDVVCSFPERELVPYLTRLGPVGVALQEADETVRAAVMKVVRPAFDAFVHGAEVRFNAACWMISAQA